MQLSNVENILKEHPINLGGIFDVECFDKDGDLKWRDQAPNLVVNAGLNHLLV
jgi:hypothetical protein